MKSTRKNLIFAMCCAAACMLFSGCGITPAEQPAEPPVTEVTAASSTTAETETAAEATETQTEAADGQNPIMNVVGRYSNGRAIMEITANGTDQADVHITWGGSALESSAWDMTGTVSEADNALVIAYQDCVKETYRFSSEGILEEDPVEYSDGTGSIRFDLAENTVRWDDEKEHAGEDSVFRILTDAE